MNRCVLNLCFLSSLIPLSYNMICIGLIVFKLQDIKEKKEHHSRILCPLLRKSSCIFGCMQDSYSTIGGDTTLLLSLFGD